MDDLGNWYEMVGGGDPWRAIPGIGTLGLTLRNRLDHMKDAKGLAFNVDLDNQSQGNYGGTCPERSRRDAVGELTSDAAEGLEVDWTAYHKVANVHYPGASGTQMQDIIFRYGPMQHRAEKTTRDAGNNLMKTTYYVHDATGNVMAIYEKAYNGGILETRLKACPERSRRNLPIYGSDRLGLRLDDTPVKGIKVHHRLSPVLVYCEAVPDPSAWLRAGLQPGMLRVAELLYDSPLTPATLRTETRTGEYVTLRNTSGIPLPLGNVRLRVPGNGSHAFLSADTLPPDHSIIVAHGTPADTGNLRLAANLPASLFSDPSVHWRWQTSLTLPDGGATLQLYEELSGVETVLEGVAFGGSGVDAPNAHCNAACQADPARPEVLAVRLVDYTDTYAYAGDPYEAGKASGKGKGGETYYTVKAVTGRKPGKKEYELNDHLGNVRVVITDIKHSVISPAGVVGSFNADVKVMRDHYAFGMEMPGQVWQAGGYRYGFNGMERDDELKGQGNSYDFGARMYDPRIGRWFSTDPLEAKYPFFNPYNFGGLNPVLYIDINGEDIHITISNTDSGKRAKIRIINSDNINGCPGEITVKLYKMTVTDDVLKTTSTYYVTRDAWVATGVTEKKTKLSSGEIKTEKLYNLVNTNFEPVASVGRYQVQAQKYPGGTELLGLALKENGSFCLSAEPNPLAVAHGARARSGFACGVMLHVGGSYVKGTEERLVGSFGCMGIFDENGVGGNVVIEKFRKDIENRNSSQIVRWTDEDGVKHKKDKGMDKYDVQILKRTDVRPQGKLNSNEKWSTDQ